MLVQGVGAEFILGTTAKRQQFEEARAVGLVGVEVVFGRCRIVEVAVEHPREYDPRELKREVYAKLIGVDRLPLLTHVGLPFIRAIEGQRETLAATEDILARHAERRSRAEVVVALRLDVHLKLTVERVIVGGVYDAVQRVSRRVLGDVLQLGVAEDAETAECLLRLLLCELRVGVAPLVLDFGVKDGRPHAQLALIVYHHVLIGNRVGRLLVVVAAQVDGQSADFPLALDHVVQSGLGDNLQRDVPGTLERVAQEGDVAWHEIEVATAAEYRAYPLTLLVQLEDTELIARLELAPAHGPADETVGLGTETCVYHRVEAVAVPHLHTIADFALPVVLPVRHNLVRHTSVEIAVVMQEIGRGRRPHLGID